MRLLYVEDEIPMARTIEALLRQEGYEFDTAHCGRDAIEMAKSKKYDLILLDIMLPDLDGYEVMDRLNLSGVETPFLVQTGLIDRDDELRGVSLGVTEYLVKPFNKNELIEGIRTAIERNAILREERQTSRAAVTSIWSGLNRREQRRFPTVKSARVVWPSRFDCVILNMSYGGAAIRLPSESQNLPLEFGLELREDTVLKCTLCWRTGDKAGIMFNWNDSQRDESENLSRDFSRTPDKQ